MARAKSFVDSVLAAFRQIRSEISIDTVEHDFSPRLGRYFCEEVLGYASSEIRYERNRTDVTLLDENKFRAVLIETKRPREDLDAGKWQDQAGKYADSSTRFVGLANGLRFLLWEVKAGERQLRVDLDIGGLVVQKKFAEDKLDSKTIEQILFLQNISKAEIWNESKYAKFNEFYAAIDVSEEAGFEKLIDRLNYVSNDLLRQYTYDAFDEYLAGYHEYQGRLKEIETLEKENGRNKKTEAKLAEAKLRTRDEFKKYSSFEGYYAWRSLSGRSEKPDEENKTVFCKESIYVLLNRLLFIRICEDKGLLKKRISNGGIEQLRELLREEILDNSEQLFKQILYHGYTSANQLYPHFFEKGNPLDWYESGDGELNRALNKTLWTLNRFNFSKVDKDILGKIYEKYLPKEERKKLGEFYTPDEVIDYILDAVGYEPSKAIEDRDLIDPACGSGGFLVRATRRLIGRYAVKFEKATPRESTDIRKWPEVLSCLTPKECESVIEAIAKHLHGFDINPFAVHITEMNLLFQVIDLYQKARQGNQRFGLTRFQVYQTDSLELPSSQAGLLEFQSPTGQSLAKDRAETDSLKKKRYDYVVGNPPYVSIKAMAGHSKAAYEKSFKVATGQYDLYSLFIELGINLLSENGRFGYIVPDAVLGRSNAQPVRDFILARGLSRALQVYGVFEDPNVANVILITKPNSTELQVAKIPFEKIVQEPDWLTLKPSLIASLPNHKILAISRVEYSLVQKINSQGKPLGLLLSELWRGEELGKKTALVKTVQKEVFRKIIFGEDIRRYDIIESGKFINPLDIEKGQKYFQKKIVIRQLGEHITAALDTDGEYVTSMRKRPPCSQRKLYDPFTY